MFQILKRPQAKSDIREAFVFIAEINEDSGLDFLCAVKETLELIAVNPFLGVERKFDDPRFVGVRMWRVKTYSKHLIFYTVGSNAVEILRLVHSSRDYRRVLKDEK